MAADNNDPRVKASCYTEFTQLPG